jgi:hypothetical protein
MIIFEIQLEGKIQFEIITYDVKVILLYLESSNLFENSKKPVKHKTFYVLFAFRDQNCNIFKV